MKNLRRIVLVLGGVVASAAVSAVAVTGCGGDDTVVNPDSGPDGGSDSTTDQTVPDTGHPDVHPDVSPDVAPDVGNDVVVTPDAEAGPPPDAGDAGYDASPILNWANSVVTAICDRTAVCCGLADSGTFDMANCQATYSTSGYAGSNVGATSSPGGNEVLDPVKAQNCLNDIAAIDCTANQVTSAQQQTLISDCFGALSGTLGVGGNCTSAAECQPTEFCDFALDSGTGTCAALRTSGQPCGDFGAQSSEQSGEACSYRGSGSSGLTCAWDDLDSGAPLPTSSWFCRPQQGANAGCTLNVDCTSALCDPTMFFCTTAEVFATPGACTFFTIQDAGTD